MRGHTTSSLGRDRRSSTNGGQRSVPAGGGQRSGTGGGRPMGVAPAAPRARHVRLEIYDAEQNVCRTRVRGDWTYAQVADHLENNRHIDRRRTGAFCRALRPGSLTGQAPAMRLVSAGPRYAIWNASPLTPVARMAAISTAATAGEVTYSDGMFADLDDAERDIGLDPDGALASEFSISGSSSSGSDSDSESESDDYDGGESKRTRPAKHPYGRRRPSRRLREKKEAAVATADEWVPTHVLHVMAPDAMVVLVDHYLFPRRGASWSRDRASQRSSPTGEAALREKQPSGQHSSPSGRIIPTASTAALWGEAALRESAFVPGIAIGGFSPPAAVSARVRVRTETFVAPRDTLLRHADTHERLFEFIVANSRLRPGSASAATAMMAVAAGIPPRELLTLRSSPPASAILAPATAASASAAVARFDMTEDHAAAYVRHLNQPVATLTHLPVVVVHRFPEGQQSSPTGGGGGGGGDGGELVRPRFLMVFALVATALAIRWVFGDMVPTEMAQSVRGATRDWWWSL